MNRIASVGVALCGLLVLTSCEAVFTYSPVAFLERDMASLPDERKLERAEEILVSGSTEEILDAYDEVVTIIAAGGDTAENNLLAAELAFAGSGVTEVFTGIVSDPTIIADAAPEDLEQLFNSLDVDLIEQGASYVQSASNDENAQISDTQYLIAGAALLASVAEQANGFDIIETPPSSGDPGYEDYQDAMSFLSAGGIDDLSDLFSL